MSDMWSLGVFLYILFTGESPFYDKNLEKMKRNIKRCIFTLSLP